MVYYYFINGDCLPYTVFVYGIRIRNKQGRLQKQEYIGGKGYVRNDESVGVLRTV